MHQRILDTHVHVWNFERAEYSWLTGDTSILNRSYHIEELEKERKEAGITDGILVQAANNREDTEWMMEVAAHTPWIKGVVGWLPLMDPDQTGILLEQFSKQPYIRGYRHLIHNEPDHRWLLQDRVIESLKLLVEYDFPYDLVGINTDHLQTALHLRERIPGLRMVFDHLNQPPILKKEKFGKWGDLVKEASSHQNFYAKISGLGTASGNFSGWSEEDLEPYIEYVLELFGNERCFCGGDWPVSLLAGSYAATWKAYKNILNRLLKEGEVEKVFYENAARFYRLP